MNYFERKKQKQKQQIMNELKNQGQLDEFRENQSKLGLGGIAPKVGKVIKNQFGKSGTGLVADSANAYIKGLDNVGTIGSFADDAIKGTTKQTSNAVSNAVSKEVAKQGTKTGAQTIGKGLGKAAPGIGAALSAKSAYDRAGKGDYIGAGLDVVSGVASFIPGIGTAIALGADALNAMKDVKKNKEMKDIAEIEKVTSENQASALNTLADKKNEIREHQANSLVNLQQGQPDMSSLSSNSFYPELGSFAPDTQGLGYIEPYNASVGNIIEQDATTPEIAQPVIAPQADTSQVDKASMVANILNAVKSAGGKVNNAVDLTQDRIGGMVDNALTKTKSGVNDFMAGYQDNRNNGFEQGDFYNQINTQEPTVTTDEQGNVVLQGGAEETKKSIMAKLGELAGTTGRLASNPYLQGLIAGGIYKATGGDVGESIKYGVDWAQDKAKSDMYAKLIGQQPGILGGKYDSKDYNAYAMNKYKDGALANQAERNKITKEHYDKQEALEQDKLDFNKNKFNTEHGEKVRHNKATESLDAQRIKKDIMKANLSSEESFIKAMSEAKKLASTDAETSNYLVERIERQRQLDLNLQSMIDRFGEDKAYSIYSDLLAETWD